MKNLHRGVCVCILLLFCSCGLLAQPSANATSASYPQIKKLKITILSTMLADAGIGEWGFSALVEAGGHRILVDTGARPNTVLENARQSHVKLSNVEDVVLTHFHGDHVGGLLTLRRELKKENPNAISRVHVAQGMFYSRPERDGSEGNPMLSIRREFEATGGRFIQHEHAAEIFAGAWLTGPVPRPFPERNWSN